jgi:hypothetical protein
MIRTPGAAKAPAAVEFDFEKPASIRPRVDELRLHRYDEITPGVISLVHLC